MRERPSQRPNSLAEVARRARAVRASYGAALREFLDSFYTLPQDRPASLAESPLPIGQIEDAYLAATAEHLALTYDLSVPSWTDAPGRSLKQPFFAGGDALMAILLVESPTAFRRRQIFISANALDRPRMHEVHETAIAVA